MAQPSAVVGCLHQTDTCCEKVPEASIEIKHTYMHFTGTQKNKDVARREQQSLISRDSVGPFTTIEWLKLLGIQEVDRGSRWLNN